MANVSNEFILHRATLVRKRFEDQEDQPSGNFDLVQALVELNLYESIFSPYIVGEALIADSSGVSSTVNFQGQEELHLVWSVHDKEYQKEFVVWKVTNYAKAGDYTATYVLQLMEKHAYMSYFRRLRNAHQGNITDIVKNVLTGELDVELVNDFEQSSQVIKALGCNRTPIEFCQWLMQRATSDFGEPMFLYSTLHNGLNMKSLGSMMGDRALDVRFNYTMTPPPTISSTLEFERARIESMSVGDIGDLLGLAQHGALRSKYFTIDPFERSIDTVEFDAAAHFSAKSEENRTLYDHTLFDENYSIDGTPIAELDSAYISGINTSRMFDRVNSFAEEENNELHSRKVARQSDIELLMREYREIYLRGYHFGAHDRNTSIGTVIDIMIPKDHPSYQASAHAIDNAKSGLYLITATRHIFNTTDRDYRATLSLGRIASPDDINNPNREQEEQRPR